MSSPFPGRWYVEEFDDNSREWEPLPQSGGYWLYAVGYLTCRRIVDQKATFRLVSKFGVPQEAIKPGDAFPPQKKGVNRG